MTTAATAASRSLAPKSPFPASSRALTMSPPTPAQRPLIISVASLILPGRIPASAADSALPPTAKMCAPRRVRFSNRWRATNTAIAITTAPGKPWISAVPIFL